MKRHDFEQRRPKLLASEGICMMQRVRIDAPMLGNCSNRQPFLKAQSKEFNSILGRAAKVRSTLPLKLGRFRHDRLRPSSFKQTGLAFLIGVEVGRQRVGGACGSEPAAFPTFVHFSMV